jgi:GGDEF domain-containing protein
VQQNPQAGDSVGWRDLALHALERLAETAVSLDPKERIQAAESAKHALEPVATSEFLVEQLGAAERTADCLIRHNEKTQESIDKVTRELTGIFRSVALLSRPEDSGEAESIETLRRMLDEPGDLREVRDRLIEATETLRTRMEENRRHQERVVGELRKQVNVLEALVDVPVVRLEAGETQARPERVSAKDQFTGLPDRGAAEVAIWQAQQSSRGIFAAAFAVPKIEFYGAKYGQETADLVALAVSRQLAGAIARPAELYRWSRSGFVAMLERPAGLDTVAREIGRYAAHSAGWYLEAQRLSLATKVEGKAFPVTGRTHQDVCAEIDAFVGA